MTVAIGIGCRYGASGQAIVALVRTTLEAAGLASEDAALFTIDAKACEAGLVQAAAQLGAPLKFLSPEALAAIETPTFSIRAKEMFGVSSVAESAALAGAGEGAVLVVPRVAREGVTCAIARAPK